MTDAQGRTRHRARLRRLDACLTQLEEANERDEHCVTAQVANLIRPYVPAVSIGMPTAEAINLVLQELEPLLGPRRASQVPVARAEPQAELALLTDHPADPLDESGARELTDRIKTATRQLCMLLVEAHLRRAWSALGYRSWEQYVRAEFGLSRSRSYQLLDQGQVITVIRRSAGILDTLDIHPYAAAQLKPRLTEIAETVRARTAGRSTAEAREIVYEVIRAERRPARRSWRPEPAVPHEPVRVGPAPDMTALYQALGNLARMPQPKDAAARVPQQHAHHLDDLGAAVRWLTEFAQEWDRRRRDELTALKRASDRSSAAV